MRNLWLANPIYNKTDLIFDAAIAQVPSPLPYEAAARSPNDTVFTGPTDCKFGRKPLDRKRWSIYVTTTGKHGQNYTFGGSLFRLDVGEWFL